MAEKILLQEQLLSLSHLQEVDLKIDELKKQLAGLPSSLKTALNAVAELKKKYSLKEAELISVRKNLAQVNSALSMNKERAERSQAKLSQATNSHEYQASIKEIDQLNKMNLSLAEQELSHNIEVEELLKDLDSLHQEIQVLEEQLKSETSKVNSAGLEFQKKIQQFDEDRKSFLIKIESPILVKYNRIRMARNGMGIVDVQGGQCQGCHMLLPPQVYNEIQKGINMHNCPSCARLLFLDKEKQSAKV